MDETKELLKAVMNAVKQLAAGQDGIKRELAGLRGEFEAFKGEMYQFRDEMHQFRDEMYRFRADVNTRFAAVEQTLGDLRQEIRDGLAHLGERWLEHDREIYSLKRKQA